MKELTKSEANWTSSGGYCKLLEVNDVTIRWYSDSKSLTLNGSSSEGIKSQIRNIASQVHPEAVTSNNNCSVAGVTALDMDMARFLVKRFNNRKYVNVLAITLVE
jgi:hypothetical protein